MLYISNIIRGKFKIRINRDRIFLPTLRFFKSVKVLTNNWLYFLLDFLFRVVKENKIFKYVKSQRHKKKLSSQNDSMMMFVNV